MNFFYSTEKKNHPFFLRSLLKHEEKIVWINNTTKIIHIYATIILNCSQKKKIQNFSSSNWFTKQIQCNQTENPYLQPVKTEWISPPKRGKLKTRLKKRKDRETLDANDATTEEIRGPRRGDSGIQRANLAGAAPDELEAQRRTHKP